MRKHIITSILLILFRTGFAQHATSGTGAFTKEIWWFDWAGFTISNGAAKTFTTNGGLTVTITFSNVSTHPPVSNVMNTWPGAILHLLYDFTDPAVQPALLDNTINIGETSSFTMKVNVTRGGLAAPFRLIAADAEASTLTETTTLRTDGSNWQTIEFFRNSSQTNDPVTGCGTQTAQLAFTYGGTFQSGQTPLLSTVSPTGSPVTMDVLLDHGNTYGGMAVAFGIWEPLDRGDLPPSYGNAVHEPSYDFFNSCNYTPPFPYATRIENLKIGAVAGDIDPLQYTDDNAIGADEDGVSSFPVYDGSGSYSVQVSLGNTTGNDAWLTGWFDYNRNGRFDNGESVTALAPDNATTATLTWTGLPPLLPQGTAQGYGFRFRISPDPQSAQQATGYLKEGEVEDYFVPSVALCSMTTSTRPDTSVCPGTPVRLLATGGDQFSWSNGQDLSDPGVADPLAIARTDTKYYVNVTNAQGCSKKDSVTISLKSNPVLTVSKDILICSGQSVSLSASGASTYSWASSDGLFQASGASIQPRPRFPTRYYVLGSNSPDNCSVLDSVDVDLHTPGSPGYKPIPPYICKNDSVLLEASGGDLYAWSSPDQTPLGSSNLLLVSPDQTESYQVQITDTLCQLTTTLQVPVVVKELPLTSVTKSNDLDCIVGQAVLQASGGIRYLWEPAPDLSDPTSSSPTVRPLHNTMYYVGVKDLNGCVSKDSIMVLVDYQTALSKYPIPSAFTPNNDGHNDCFGLKYWGRIMNLSMEVYDRMGLRVFYTKDPGQCWDGSFNGRMQPAGTYVYQIVATTPCGTAYRKGTVLLIR